MFWAALVVMMSQPAYAHGPTPDGTNYDSQVTAVVDTLDDVAVDVAAVDWQVLGGDGLLQVRNDGDRDLVVMGYDGEPYLRVGPDGVFENRRSAATYLNADRFGDVVVPDGVDPAAPPEWRRLSDDGEWRWHDHRIHWMAPTAPPRVRNRPDTPQRVLDWAVPFRFGDQRLQVRGVLDYIPPPALWPWLFTAALALSVPIVVLLAAGQTRRATRTLAALIIAVAAAGLVLAIGDALVTPVSLGANLWAVVQTGGIGMLSAALAWTVWQPTVGAGEDRTGPVLIVAALVVAITGGLGQFGQLSSSLVVNALPAPVVRGVVAASLVVAFPALLLAVPRRAQRTA